MTDLKKEKKKRIAIDLDGTLTKKGMFPEIWNLTPTELYKIYETIPADKEMVGIVNGLYDKGYVIYIFTSRTDLYQKLTETWLKKNKVKYHYYLLNKPFYDIIIDDKAIRPEEIKLWASKL